jgi:hypothetical protein
VQNDDFPHEGRVRQQVGNPSKWKGAPRRGGYCFIGEIRAGSVVDAVWHSSSKRVQYIDIVSEHFLDPFRRVALPRPMR